MAWEPAAVRMHRDFASKHLLYGLIRHVDALGTPDGKRGPGRPPVRLTSQASLLGARASAAAGKQRRGSGLKPDPAAAPETNELIGRKIWRAPFPCLLCVAPLAPGSNTP